MVLFAKPLSVPEASAALASAEARHAGFETERAQALSAADAEPDFDKGLKLRAIARELDDKLAQSKIAVEHARQSLETARTAAAQAEADQQHKAAEKRAAEDFKRARRALAHAAELGSEVNEI
jgi:hypothetical protein